MIFNLLFVSLTFQLNGTINRKLGIMALGNVIGLLWSFTLYFFAIAGTTFLAKYSVCSMQLSTQF